MKNALKLFAVCAFFALLFVAGSGEVQAQSTNGYIGRAHSAPGISQCLNDARQSGYEIRANVQEETVNCLVPPCPTFYTVTFYGQFKCRPGAICPAGPILLVAQVVMDDQGNILSYSCGNPSI